MAPPTLTRGDVMNARQVAELLGDDWSPRRVRDRSKTGPRRIPSVGQGIERRWIRWQVEAWILGEWRPES